MTPDFPQNDREKLEAKLTALLLGELPAHEAAALHSAMDDDPDLAELYERLKQTIELVRESTAQPSAERGVRNAELKLSPERREKLLAQFKTVKPAEFAEPAPKRSRLYLVQIAAALAIVAILAAMILPAFTKARSTASRNTLVNNLRLIDGAKQTWALEANASENATPGPGQIAAYLGRGNSVTPEDLSPLAIPGVTYVIGKVDEIPRVETTVAQAKKWMGNRPIPESAIHNGRVQLTIGDTGGLAVVDNESPLQTMTVTSAGLHQAEEFPRQSQQSGEFALNRAITVNGNGHAQSSSQLAEIPPQTLAPPAPVIAPPPANTQIVLPSSNESDRGAQFTMNNTATFGVPEVHTLNAGKGAYSYQRENGQGYGPTAGIPVQSSSAPSENYLGLATNYVAANDSWSFPMSGTPEMGHVGDIITNGLAGNPDWIGALQKPAELHSADNRFTSRFTFLPQQTTDTGTLQVDQTNLLAWSSVVSGVAATNVLEEFPMQSANAADISEALKQLGYSNDNNGLASDLGVFKSNDVSTRSFTWSTNTSGDLLSEGTVSATSGRESKFVVDDKGEMHPIEGDSTETNGQFYTGLSTEDVSKLRDLATNEQTSTVLALSSSNMSGYVDTSASWNLGASNGSNPGFAFGGFGGAGKSRWGSFDGSTNGAVITAEPDSRNVIINADDETTKQLLAAIRKLDQPSRQQLAGSGGTAPISGSNTSDETTISGGTLAANNPQQPPEVTVVHLQNAAPQEVAKALREFEASTAQHQQQIASTPITPAAGDGLITQGLRPTDHSYVIGSNSSLASSETLAENKQQLQEFFQGQRQTTSAPTTANNGTVQIYDGGAMLGPIPATPPPPPQSQQTRTPIIVAQQTSPMITREQQQPDNQQIRFGGGGGGGFGGRGFGEQENLTQPATSPPSPPRSGDLSRLGSGERNVGESPDIKTEVFKVDPNTFYAGLQNVGSIQFGTTKSDENGSQRQPASRTPQTVTSSPTKGIRYVTGFENTLEVQGAVSNFFDSVGVNLDATKGKSFFFNDRQGTLTVRGSADDLDLIKAAVDTLNTPVPPVTIATKFADVNSNNTKSQGFDWNSGDVLMTNSITAQGGSQPLQTQLADAKKQLDEDERFRQLLAAKTGEEQAEKELPRASMVTVVDAATPASTEKPTFGEKLRRAFSSNVERAARITVEQDRPDISAMSGPGNTTGYDPYFLETEFGVIRSKTVLERAAKALNLDKNGQVSDDTIAKLKKEIELHPVENTKEIEIGATAKTAEDAARIANAVAQAYRQYRMDEWEGIKARGIKGFQEQLDYQDKKLALAQAKVDELRKELNISGGTSLTQTSPTPELDTALPKPATPPPTPQPEILTSSNAFSTFSLNVSDVSFKLAAASLEKGQMPDPASIRSEEFINAFDYRDPEAAPGTPVAFNSERARYPFAHNRELLRFSLKTAAAGRQQGRPLNIVLLLDNSGSMERADRVRIIQEALRVLAAQLQPRDTFSIVTFARTARLRVDGIPGNQAAAAAEEISKLTPEGGTNLGDALDAAYETALHHYLAGGDNRVVMLTDGAANLGDVNSDSLKSKVVAHRQQGISLDCFGIGWEGYNDDLLEVLTRDGDGRYGFINTPEEASTEFATQIAGALHVAAQDVKVQVEFNPARVTSYRQIGYAKHQLTKEQFRDNTVAAAQIAAQEAGNALYTIEINPQGEGSIGTVHVRYRIPGTSDYREQQWDVPYTGGAQPLDQSSPAMRLAATASAFSEWLATSPFADQVSTDQLLNYLNGIPQIYGADTRPQKLEWMIRQARSISGK